MSADNDDAITRYGFSWGPVAIERMATFPRDGGECRVIGIYTGAGDDRKRRLEIYVSPTGRSVRVFRDGEELA